MGQAQLGQGIIVNYCPIPIRYEVLGTVQRLLSQKDSETINSQSNVSGGPTGFSAGFAGIKKNKTKTTSYTQVRGFVEVQPGRQSCLGLNRLKPHRHAISVFIQLPGTKQIRYFIRDVVVNSVNEIRLNIYPSGAVKSMTKEEHKDHMDKLDKEVVFTKEEKLAVTKECQKIDEKEENQIFKIYDQLARGLITNSNPPPSSVKAPVNQPLVSANLSSNGAGNKPSIASSQLSLKAQPK